MRDQLENKGELLLPWILKSRISDWPAILQYANTYSVVQVCSSWVNAMTKEEERENTDMGYWEHYSEYLKTRQLPVVLFDYRIAGIVLPAMSGCLDGAEQILLDLIDSSLKDENLRLRGCGPGVDFSLGSALIAAAACGSWRLIELLRLIQAKTGIMLLQGNFADTALHKALAGEYETVITLLIDASANVNARGGPQRSGRTALQTAAEYGHEAIVKLLIDKGADVNGKPAWNSVLIGVDAGVDTEAAKGFEGTALQVAAGHGYGVIVKLLIDEGADVNAKAVEDNGRTALQAAAENGHEAFVKLLIDDGADVNSKAANNHGRTALQAAAGNGHEAIVKLLIDKGRMSMQRQCGTLEEQHCRRL